MAEYRLLTEFRKLFQGQKYEHRRSNLGDFVAMQLFEDLVSIAGSSKYLAGVADKVKVLNVRNQRMGIEARRGDGTFGDLVPGSSPTVDDGYLVARGPIATVEIGVEVKILAKAMIKQIDRVNNDLANQVQHFRRKSGMQSPICVGLVGINHATVTTSYEGERSYRTDGSKYKHPIQEAAEAQRRLQANIDNYDEFLLLRYSAINEAPFEFSWVNEAETAQRYAAALLRISKFYQQRF